MPPIQRKVVFDESVPWEGGLVELDLRRFQLGFAALMERAAAAVQVLGYEQDDSVVERLLVCQAGAGQPVTVGADWLADRERLIGHVAAQVGTSAGRAVASNEVAIVALRVVATLEQWPAGG
jgi:hypothetical protein